MKTANRIITFLVVLGIMTSCTQRRYSHVTGFQLNKNSKTEKTTRAGHYVKLQNIKPGTPDYTDAVPTIEKFQITDASPRMKKLNGYKNVVKTSNVKTALGNEEVELAVLPTMAKFQQSIAPKNVFNKVKSKVGKKTKDGGLIYWILVLVLLLLIIALMESILGQGLTRLLILILLLVFVGHLLGLW